RWSDNRDRMTCGNVEAYALQDRTRRLVGKHDIVEADISPYGLQRPRAGPVLHLGLAAEDLKHRLDVDDALLDLAIDHAHEVERLIKLDHHRVDHHEIADRLRARGDLGGAHHHRRA